MKQLLRYLPLFFLLMAPAAAFAQGEMAVAGSDGLHLFGIRLEFYLFVATLVGIAFFHHRTLQIALSGLVVILVTKFLTTNFNLVHHLKHEWEILLNLFGLLLGFAILAKHFEESGVPDRIPRLLPRGWAGPLLLLVLVFVMSSFLDNIAAAMIGGSIAIVIFRQNVHIGFIAAIVAASNAGGAGSVVGDTTTTMMWIDGVHPVMLIEAYSASLVAFLIFGFLASRQQFALQPVVFDPNADLRPIRYNKLIICLMILAGAISTNILLDFPAAGVWAAILIGALFAPTPWGEARHALRGSAFLLSVVLCASMMPVDELPPASWQSAFVLGFVSSVFDNIPLTKLALDQSNYDWGMLAYAVGFGGSITWFGSSAGVAITNLFPEGRHLGKWVRGGWHIIIAYVAGFFAMLLLFGWNPFDHLKG